MAFQIGIKDIIDIFVVALILYEAYKILRRSGVSNLFWGIFAFIILWFATSYIFKLELTGALFDRIISVGAIALIVIFQDEIRSFFSHIGSRFNWRFARHGRHSKQIESDRSVMQIVIACKNMAKTKTGALIVLARQQSLAQYCQSGERLDAIISARLIENIFFKNTPLHDGALIIVAGRLHSAACIMPVSKNLTIPQHYGLRHRAALGIAEKTDALTIIVSEETGDISIAVNDTIRTVRTEELEQILSQEMTII